MATIVVIVKDEPEDVFMLHEGKYYGDFRLPYGFGRPTSEHWRGMERGTDPSVKVYDIELTFEKNKIISEIIEKSYLKVAAPDYVSNQCAIRNLILSLIDG